MPKSYPYSDPLETALLKIAKIVPLSRDQRVAIRLVLINFRDQEERDAMSETCRNAGCHLLNDPQERA